MKILIKSVDMNGYLGRDRHPQKSDVGRVGKVIRVSSETTHKELFVADSPDHDLSEMTISKAKDLYNDETVIVDIFYDVVFENGEILTLHMDEVEVLRK